jgi:predicted nuclease of predicted toxin-antitoxin system
MRLLANENFPLDAVTALHEAGHDVAWIREDSRGASDDSILQRAQQEDRIIVTFDKDFGELAFRSKLPAQSGVILFRITPRSPQYIAQAAVQALASRDNWVGHFSVVEDTRIRMTSLTQE